MRVANDPSVEQIIAKARSSITVGRGAWAISGASLLLMWASFTPLDWGPLAWVALVPLILLVRLPQPMTRMYRWLYVTGFVYNLALLQWMRLGHATMYAALVALSIYMAMYVPAFVALSRVAVHRLRMPLVLAVPTIWVGLELLRAHLMTGFSWYYLGHTQHAWVELIQISDITGAYGVSFVVAMVSACVAGLVPLSVLAKLRLVPADSLGSAASQPLGRQQVISVVACTLVFGAVLTYGYVRRGQAEFRDGPRVALVQGNFPSSVKADPNSAGRIFQTHHYLTGRVVQYQPDLIVWPETMYRWPLMLPQAGMTDADLQRAAPRVPLEMWRDTSSKNAITEMSQQAGAALMIGLEAVVANPDEMHIYNSAAFVTPETGISGRYDKRHLVVFGEYIPLKDWLPWLSKLTPYSGNLGLTSGDRFQAFEYKGFTFAPVICFEDTVPHVVRSAVASGREGQPADCLVNLTNDGWFHGSSELDQHLITASFRSVELRTPTVRAVNTGVSAIIDGDGIVREPEVFIDGDGLGRKSMRDEANGRWHKQLNAAMVSPVPLDNRSSLYLACGDWFAGICFCVTAFVLMAGLVLRRKSVPPVPVLN